MLNRYKKYIYSSPRRMFEKFKTVSPDTILQVNARAKTDTHPNTVNLSIGEYKNDQGLPHVPATVQESFRKINTSNFGYTPAAGLHDYLQATSRLLLENFDTNRIAMQATTGGTGALSLLQQMIQKAQHRHPDTVVHIGTPTRGNHIAIFGNNGIQIPHLTPDNEVNMHAFKEVLNSHPEYPILIQGGNTHNPTGINFTHQQAQELVDIARDKKIQVIIDMAYFGLGQTFAEDQKRLKLFWDHIDDIAMTISYSKNASIYNMRTGALFIKTDNKEAVESHMQQLCRATVSTAPATGQHIVADILNNPAKKESREKEVGFMRGTLQRRRKMLTQALADPRFAYIDNGAGLFAMLPLTPEQVELLASKYHIYILPSGRINIAGITDKNVSYVADSIKAVS